MPANPIFSVRGWIADNLHASLSDDAFEAVCNFTLMWNLFEATLCGRLADRPAIDHLASQIDNAAPVPVVLATSLDFWRRRYIEMGKPNHHFDDLKFRPKHRKAFVAEVLLGAKTTASDQFLGILIIIFRLRNNLFHGEKAVHLLDGQITNLQTAAITLAYILQMGLNPRTGQYP